MSQNSVSKIRLYYDLNILIISISLIFFGRLFHNVATLKWNVLWPDTDLYRGIFKSFLYFVLTSWSSALIWNLWHKYVAANPFIHLKAITASLTLSRSWTRSHFNCWSAGVIWLYFLVPVMMRTANFCTLWSLDIFFFAVIDHTEKQ